MVFIFGIIIALVIIVVLFMYMITQPVPAPPPPQRVQFKDDAHPTAAAPAPAAAPAAAPATKITTYKGNNGTINGNRYCSGSWESTGDKNLKCVGGKNTATGAVLDCSTIYGLGSPYEYDCSSDAIKYKTYIGNNGTISGVEYCKGAWESPNNTNKNLICTYGQNTTTGAVLDCSTVYGAPGGPYAYDCSSDTDKYKTYTGNNGSISGVEYCKGVWESPNNTNKNLNCISGRNETSNTPIDCSTVGVVGLKYTYICG